MIAKSAVCKESASGTEANFPGSSTETYDAESVVTVGLVVTAGLEKLSFKVDASTTVEGRASATSTEAGGSAGSMSSARPPVSTSVSVTGSAATPAATGAAAANAVGGGLLSIVAGVLGGLLL